MRETRRETFQILEMTIRFKICDTTLTRPLPTDLQNSITYIIFSVILLDNLRKLYGLVYSTSLSADTSQKWLPVLLFDTESREVLLLEPFNLSVFFIKVPLWREKLEVYWKYILIAMTQNLRSKRNGYFHYRAFPYSITSDTH